MRCSASNRAGQSYVHHPIEAAPSRLRLLREPFRKSRVSWLKGPTRLFYNVMYSAVSVGRTGFGRRRLTLRNLWPCWSRSPVSDHRCTMQRTCVASVACMLQAAGKKRKQACKLASTAIHDHDQHAASEGVNQVNMVSTCLPSQCSEHFAPVAGPAWSSSNEKTITSVDGDSPDDFYFADSSISRTTTACDGGIPKVENLACLHE